LQSGRCKKRRAFDVSLYIDGSRAVKWQPTPKSRLRLGGTLHVEGWAAQARAYRALLGAIYPRTPSCAPKGGSEKVALEIIEHIHLLDNRALNLLRFNFAELVKTSRR
jgi:hypothetical protein